MGRASATPVWGSGGSTFCICVRCRKDRDRCGRFLDLDGGTGRLQVRVKATAVAVFEAVAAWRPAKWNQAGYVELRGIFAVF